MSGFLWRSILPLGLYAVRTNMSYTQLSATQSLPHHETQSWY